MSGTAAKLGGKVAYHHFTLLVDANLDNVKKYLSQSEVIFKVLFRDFVLVRDSSGGRLPAGTEWRLNWSV